MVAVGILVPYAPDLTELNVRVGPLAASPRRLLVGRSVRIVPRLAGHLAILLSEVLAGQQEHLLVEAADDGDLGLGRCRSLLLLC